MLDGLRAIAKTWFGKIIGAFLIVGLAGFGISNVLLDLGTNNVATVGDQNISVRTFQRAYNDRLNQVAQQIGRLPTAEEATAIGIPGQVLLQLGSDAALNQLGQSIGIGVSDARLSKMLREDPSFGDLLGRFDAQNFSRILQQNGFTEEEYFNLQRNAARRQQVAQGLFVDAAVPTAAAELVAGYGADQRTVEYFTLSAETALPPADPTDEELAAYLTEHQATFRTLETRTADVVALTPEVLAATVTITDEDVAAEYERTKAQRVKIERRTIKQVPLPTATEETAFETGKTAGKTFDDLVTETGLKPSDVGNLTQAEITDTDLATAAFALAQGDFAIIPGIGGKRAVTVTAIEPGGQISLANASTEIKSGLAMTQARADYIDILDQIEELRAAFQPLTDIAARFNLPLTEVTLTPGGSELAAVAAIPDTARGRVAGAIFAATAEQKLAPTITISTNTNVWFDLKSTELARDQTMDEVRDAVLAAWTAEKIEEQIIADTEKAVADLKAGTPISDVGLGLSQFATQSSPINRDGKIVVAGNATGDAVFGPAVASAVFAGGPSHFGSAVDTDGAHVIFQVVDVTPAETAANAAAKTVLADTRQNTLYSDFMAGLRETTGMTVNQQALNQSLALDTSGN